MHYTCTHIYKGGANRKLCLSGTRGRERVSCTNKVYVRKELIYDSVSNTRHLARLSLSFSRLYLFIVVASQLR